MRRPATLALAALFCAAIGATDEAHFRVPTQLAAHVEAGERCGVITGIETRGDGALVTVSRSVRAFAVAPEYPLRDARACPDPEAVEVPLWIATPAKLAGFAAETHSALDVLERVVGWVGRKIVLDDADTGPQDGRSVLQRGRGRCSGRANAAIGLLRSLGIPSRVVHGLLVGRSGARWHRWGEAWLGDAGWVAFDPGASVGVVGVRYLAVRGAGEGASAEGVRLEFLDEPGYLSLPRRNGLRVVPVGGVTLRCQAPRGAGEFTAFVLGPDGTPLARSGRDEVVFAGLLPGRFRVTWCAQGECGGVVQLDRDQPGEVRMMLRRAGGEHS